MKLPVYFNDGRIILLEQTATDLIFYIKKEDHNDPSFKQELKQFGKELYDIGFTKPIVRIVKYLHYVT